MLDKIKVLFNEPPKLGVIGPDVYDSRDYLYEAKNKLIGPSGVNINNEFTLQPLSCDVLDQKDTNSCTGYSAACACNILISKILGNKKNYNINPFYIYYFARKIDGLELLDNGAYMRSLMKALKRYGFCSCDMSTTSQIPTQECEDNSFKIKDYRRISNSIEDIQYALQVEQLPILISFAVDYSLINHYNGIISYKNERNIQGYHAVAILGWKYINDQLYFIIQNSWGSSYGNKGYYYLDSRYILSSDLVPDIWTFTSDYSFIKTINT